MEKIMEVNKQTVKKERRINTKKNKNNNNIKKPFWVQLIVSLCILAVACCLFTYRLIIADSNEQINNDTITITKDDEGAELFVVGISEGTSLIAERLKEEGFIKSINTFKIIAKFEGYDHAYVSGSHYLKKGLEQRDIMKILSSENETKLVRFPEGLTVKAMAKILEQEEICTANEFIATVNNIENELDLYDDKKKLIDNYPFLKDIDFSKRTYMKLEGYLFPDTYYFDISADPREIITIMLNNFSNRYLSRYSDKAKTYGFLKEGETEGLITDKVITLASIIEKEAKLSSERRIISGVFCNRLFATESEAINLGRKLESCASVNYYFEMNDLPLKSHLSNEDVQIDSLYNTYKYEGLPTGPICNPGLESIIAAINADTERGYYYFVADTTNNLGSHRFAKNYAEHEKNIKDIENETKNAE